MFIRTRNICTILLTIFIAAACGGSNDGGIAPPPPPTGGITRTGVAVAVGPITGFGSVIVNGVRYDTSSAMFSKDGVAAVQADFSVGQFVVVTGTIDDNNSNAVAATVEFDDVVEGPVSSVDSVARTFVVLGQTVLVSADTSIDDDCPANPDDFLTVAAVEVSGPVMDGGKIAATRIDCKAVLDEMEVTGLVSNLNIGATTFNINALTVNYSAASLDDFPSGAISDGDLVEAKGTTLGASDELIATRVEFKGARFADDEGDHVEVEGFITDFVSATSFTVSTFPVTTDGNTTYEPAGFSAADLGPNLKVEVEGEFDSAGILLATKLEFKQAKNIRVTGLVDSVSGDTLVILDITITTDAILTRFEDKTNANVDPLSIADIVAGDYLEVRGQEFPAGSGELAAALLEREDPDVETELRGFVEVGGVNRPSLTILGVTIDTDAATVYRDALDQPILADDFWAQVAEGSLVDADGIETSVNSILANELEFEDED